MPASSNAMHAKIASSVKAARWLHVRRAIFSRMVSTSLTARLESIALISRASALAMPVGASRVLIWKFCPPGGTWRSAV